MCLSIKSKLSSYRLRLVSREAFELNRLKRWLSGSAAGGKCLRRGRVVTGLSSLGTVAASSLASIVAEGWIVVAAAEMLSAVGASVKSLMIAAVSLASSVTKRATVVAAEMLSADCVSAGLARLAAGLPSVRLRTPFIKRFN